MLTCALRTVLVYFSVLLVLRLTGKRQLGELQPAELVTMLLISDVASVCIDDPDLPLLASLLPMALLGVLEIFYSTLLWFFPRCGRLLLGSPVTVICDGRVCWDALARLRITAADLLETLRAQGVYAPENALWCAVEANGQITVIPRAAKGEPAPMLPLLADGFVYRDNLALLGRNEAWLKAHLAEKGLDYDGVLYLLSDGSTDILAAKSAAQGGRRFDAR